MANVLIGAVVVALVVLMVRGLWRATAVQKGTGCPCCDKAMGIEHEHEQGGNAGKSAAKGSPVGAKP